MTIASKSYRLKQLVAAVGTEGSFTEGNIVAANAIKVFDLDFPRIETAMFDRNVQRETFGRVAKLVQNFLVRTTFSTELRGSGTPGTPPPMAALLKGCGWVETINSGVAVVGARRANPANTGTAGPDLALTGTYTGAKSGTLEATMLSLVTDTSVTMHYEFRAGDGTTYGEQTITHINTTPTALDADVADGLSAAPTNDPSSSTTGWAEGDRFLFKLTSDTEVSVSYIPAPDRSGMSALDMAVYHDGSRMASHSARGNMSFVAEAIGAPVRLDFDFMSVLAEDPTDAALLSSVPWDAIIGPSFRGATFDIGGNTLCTSAFSIDNGNTVRGKDCHTAISGFETVRISDRAMTGSFTQESVLFATNNPYTDLIDALKLSLNIVISEKDSSDVAVPGNIVTLAGNRLQRESVAESDNDGDSAEETTFNISTPEFDAGGAYEEVTLTFT